MKTKQELVSDLVSLMRDASRRTARHNGVKLNTGARLSSAPVGRFRIVEAPEQLLDAATRDCYLRRIRALRDGWRMHILVDQEAFGVASLELLDDASLIDLLQKLERGRECLQEGVSFEDAGLISNPLG